jgi:hypothetical protein
VVKLELQALLEPKVKPELWALKAKLDSVVQLASLVRLVQLVKMALLATTERQEKLAL